MKGRALGVETPAHKNGAQGQRTRTARKDGGSAQGRQAKHCAYA